MRISDWSSDVCSSDLSYQEDLFGSIEKGDYPQWTLFVQVMPEAEAAKTPYNPFDLTKVWPHGDYPLIEVGVMELNRNPDNYFAELEQAAFSPSNVVPGIGHSPDKVPKARLLRPERVLAGQGV